MKDNIHGPSCPWHGVNLDDPSVDEMDGTPCTCRAKVKQEYTIRLEFPNGDGRSWPIMDSYFDRRWHALSLKVHKAIIDHDKECAFTLEDNAAEEEMEAEFFKPSFDLSKIPCQEANSMGIEVAGEPVPCGQPGAKVVFHQRDGRNVYVMCKACAYHNIRNRRGVELIPTAQPEPKSIDRWIEWEINQEHYDDCKTPSAPHGDCAGGCIFRRYREAIESLQRMVIHKEKS